MSMKKVMEYGEEYFPSLTTLSLGKNLQRYRKTCLLVVLLNKEILSRVLCSKADEHWIPHPSLLYLTCLLSYF